jgi:hypothetical protein
VSHIRFDLIDRQLHTHNGQSLPAFDRKNLTKMIFNKLISFKTHIFGLVEKKKRLIVAPQL